MSEIDMCYVADLLLLSQFKPGETEEERAEREALEIKRVRETPTLHGFDVPPAVKVTL